MSSLLKMCLLTIFDHKEKLCFQLEGHSPVDGHTRISAGCCSAGEELETLILPFIFIFSGKGLWPNGCADTSEYIAKPCNLRSAKYRCLNFEPLNPFLFNSEEMEEQKCWNMYILVS